MGKENDFLKEWVLTKRRADLRHLFPRSGIFKLPPLLLPFGITFYNETPVGTWLNFQWFSGAERQRRISRGKRLICYLMQLNSICQAILSTCPWRDWGIWNRMRAINIFPEVALRKGTDPSMLEFRTELLAANHEGDPVTSSLCFSKCFTLTCVWKEISIPLFFFSPHFHDKKDIKFLFKGWIAKFLFLCLKCLWNFDFAAEWLHHRSWSQEAWYWCLFGGGDTWKLFSCLEVIQLPQFYVKYLRQLFWSSSEFCIHQNWVASEPVWTDCISISVLLLSISKLFF